MIYFLFLGDAMLIRTFNKITVALSLVTGFVFCASLDIYQDGARYRTIPTGRYLGFGKGVSTSCEGKELSLTKSGECSPKERLCKLRDEVQVLQAEEASVRYASEALEKMLSLAKPTEIDASRWIDAATKIGKHKSELLTKQLKLSKVIQAKRQLFSRQAPSAKPLFLQKKCAGELELTIPAGMIGARLLYEADTSDPTAITIRQYIALSNRSGIDIVAKEARLYARSYRTYLKPQVFSPWIAQREPERRYAKSRAVKKMAYAEAAMLNEAGDIAPVAPATNVGAVMHTGYKNYQLSGIELPSTGEEIRVKVADYSVPAQCELVSYPYRDPQVYRACSFSPKSSIESHRWRIQKQKRLVSDQAYGTYRDGKYLLNVERVEELLIDRKPIVKRDRSSGIFGGSIRKKDGFVLQVTNISSETKTVKITERIPTSTTDKIKVKLLKVEGADSHTLQKDGRVELLVSLAPNAHKEIRVMFELRYDKETKVVY